MCGDLNLLGDDLINTDERLLTSNKAISSNEERTLSQKIALDQLDSNRRAFDRHVSNRMASCDLSDGSLDNEAVPKVSEFK
jgi:hypothetical protein